MTIPLNFGSPIQIAPYQTELDRMLSERQLFEGNIALPPNWRDVPYISYRTTREQNQVAQNRPVNPDMAAVNNRGQRIVRRGRRTFISSASHAAKVWEDRLVNNLPYTGSAFSWGKSSISTKQTDIFLYGVVIARYRNDIKSGIVELIYPENQTPKFYNLMRFFWRNTTFFKVVRYKEITLLSSKLHKEPLKIKPGSITYIQLAEIKVLFRNLFGLTDPYSKKVEPTLNWPRVSINTATSFGSLMRNNNSLIFNTVA